MGFLRIKAWKVKSNGDIQIIIEIIRNVVVDFVVNIKQRDIEPTLSYI